MVDPEVQKALNDLADLVPGTALVDFRDALLLAKKQKRFGTCGLVTELAHGPARDGWIDTHFRPRKSVA